MLKSFWFTLKQTFWAWNDHEVPRLGAALSFYTMLSLAPLVILVIAIASLVFGHSAAQNEIIRQVQGVMGEEGAKAVETVIGHGQKPTGVFASVIGAITLLIGASGAFSELQSALNKIWGVQPKDGSGVASLISLIRARLFSFGMVLAVGFLLLVSLVITAVLAVLGKFFGEILPMPEVLMHTINFVVSFAGISALFALIFKYVPEARIEWKDVWEGAVATALLFTIGKSLIGLYLGKAAVGSAYGAAGSLIVVIVWVYYSALIFFFGAEFAHVRATVRQGAHAGP
jgi:membrane protein